MRSLTIITLQILLTQSTGDELVDNLVNEMVDLTPTEKDLEDTTLAIAAASSTMSKVRIIQNKLKALGMPPSKYQELALTGMVGQQTCGPNPARTEFQRAFSELGQDYMGRVPEPMKVDIKNMAGVSAPLGYWDPLGLSSTFNVGQSSLMYFKEAEIKHGRVCMLATLGIFAGEKYHPFLGGDVDLPAAEVRSMLLETDFQDFWLAGLIFIAGLEVASVQTQFDEPFWEFDTENNPDGVLSKTGGFSTQLKKKDRLPGEFGFDPLGLKPTNPVELKEIQTKEINNGRLAMLATIGMLGQELVTREKIFN
jgi:hypothetical protein